MNLPLLRGDLALLLHATPKLLSLSRQLQYVSSSMRVSHRATKKNTTQIIVTFIINGVRKKEVLQLSPDPACILVFEHRAHIFIYTDKTLWHSLDWVSV